MRGIPHISEVGGPAPTDRGDTGKRRGAQMNAIIGVSEIIRRYEEGVRFECGCEERGLHPAIVRALDEGRVGATDLMRCPVHRQPMAEREDVAHWSV
jgi:hypothetical protein